MTVRHPDHLRHAQGRRRTMAVAPPHQPDIAPGHGIGEFDQMQAGGIGDRTRRQYGREPRVANGREDRLDRIHLQDDVRRKSVGGEIAVDILARAEFGRQQHQRQGREFAH
ncbi:MAG TPA: hypothetical protein VE224_03365, partial [Pseudolabrys sp.]|nr:hypothetical protein [Pseudolabrys sp.]